MIAKPMSLKLVLISIRVAFPKAKSMALESLSILVALSIKDRSVMASDMGVAFAFL